MEEDANTETVAAVEVTVEPLYLVLASAVFSEDANEPLDADADTAVEAMEAAFASIVLNWADTDVDRRVNVRLMEPCATAVISLMTSLSDC